MGDAKWKASPVVSQPSKTDPSKVLVDWKESIKNPSCVDEYYVWVWKQGQDKKTQGKKFTISDNKVTSKLVDIEPCVFYNFGLELYEKDWINKHMRESEVVSYNSAALPSFNSSDVLQYFRVGYFKDPRTGVFDVTKASIKFQTKFMTFASCIKHVEVTGKQKVGIAGVKTAMKGPVPTTENDLQARMGGASWEAYGSGRQPGDVGRPVSRGWRWNSGGGFNSGSNGGWNSGSSGGGFNSGSTGGYNPGTSTNRPPAHGPDWEYPSSTSRPSSSAGTGDQGFNPGSGWGSAEGGYNPGTSGSGGFRPGLSGRSGFSKQYVRMIQSPSSAKAGPVKKTPPFLTDEVEIVVPVEACKEYDFEMTIVSPKNSQLGKITNIHLPVLADIPDYVPPAFTTVLQISLQGGKPQLEVTRSSPIPDTCMPEYLEAMDAFANRLEAVANKHKTELQRHKSRQDNVQDKVELTQAETLNKQGCKCSSPRLELRHDDSETKTTYESVKAKHNSGVFGVYLYEGMREGRPYYKLDLQQKSLPGTMTRPNFPQTRKKRSPRIGRVDGGSSSTTQRPWNYGSGRSPSRSSSHGSTGWTNIPIQRASSTTSVTVVPRYLYWEPKAKQWLVSPQVGAAVASAEFGSAPGSKAVCPADSTDEVWQSKVPSLRSGSDRWLPDSAIKIECSPDL
eukprot:TRINITY_DN3064_c0_g1_i2.p1 TRINITY_DN3064_c0_g1~~TRINITY_DN3064_c0_g1_i2.p1  ORF type:complete len:699 (-),score=174.03 TRINITY_DN3064_c0_g1_i2:66-2090(-)